MSNWRGDNGDLQLRQDFCDRYSREQVAAHAERLLGRYVDGGGSCFTFGHSPDGLIGHSIRTLLVRQIEPSRITDKLVRALMKELDFTSEWIPPRLLVREALAYAVRIHQVVRRLNKELCAENDLRAIIDRTAIPLDSAEAAFLLPDESIDELIESIR